MARTDSGARLCMLNSAWANKTKFKRVNWTRLHVKVSHEIKCQTQVCNMLVESAARETFGHAAIIKSSQFGENVLLRNDVSHASKPVLDGCVKLIYYQDRGQCIKWPSSVYKWYRSEEAFNFTRGRNFNLRAEKLSTRKSLKIAFSKLAASEKVRIFPGTAFEVNPTDGSDPEKKFRVSTEFPTIYSAFSDNDAPMKEKHKIAEWFFEEGQFPFFSSKQM